MDEDLVSTYLQTKLRSHLEEAEKEAGRSESIMLRFNSLEEQMKSACRRRIDIPADLLYEVMRALSDCRVFSYERRPTSKAAHLIHVLHHPLSEFFFKRRMSKRLDEIKEQLGNLSRAGAGAPQAPVVPLPQTETPISDIIGFQEQVAQIQEWLKHSSADAFIEIAIVGKRGCGKTALARKVFASAEIEKEFSPLIFWVCLSGTTQEQEARERVVKCIKEKIGRDGLNGKRYLMVLDDAWWLGEVDLDLPKGSGGALILTTRREKDLATHNHVIRLEPQLSDETCWQIFSNAAHQQAKLDPAEPLLTTIQNDATRNSRRRALAVNSLGTIIPDLLLQRKHWIRARDLSIIWSDTSSYWKWRKEGTEEVAELLDVCWLDITGTSKLNMFLWNRRYSAYLVYKLKEENYNLEAEMEARMRILIDKKEKDSSKSSHHVYIAGDHPGPVRWAEAGGTEWMEIKLGEFLNDISDHGAEVEAKLFESGDWKSGLIVKGISFRLNAPN